MTTARILKMRGARQWRYSVQCRARDCEVAIQGAWCRSRDEAAAATPPAREHWCALHKRPRARSPAIDVGSAPPVVREFTATPIYEVPPRTTFGLCSSCGGVYPTHARSRCAGAHLLRLTYPPFDEDRS